MSQYYFRGVKTGKVYQFWIGNGGLASLPSGFTDPYGNVKELVPNYAPPGGQTVEDVVQCLPFGMVRLGTAGPPSPPNIFNPGHIFSPFEQDTQH